MVLMKMGGQPCAGKMLRTSMPFYSWLWEASACPTIGLSSEPSSQNQCQHAGGGQETSSALSMMRRREGKLDNDALFTVLRQSLSSPGWP